MSPTPHIDWIDKAKGFAILGVVALHVIHQFTITGTMAKIATAGIYGVSLFFIISAYLSFLSFDNNPTKWNIRTYTKYLFRKIIRLAPVLYIAILWHFIQYCIVIKGIPDFSDGIWLDVLFSATFTNAFSYLHFNPWVNWYIGTLVLYIAIAPVIHKWINTPLRSIMFFGISLIFAWVLRLILSIHGIPNYDFFIYCSLPIQLPVIALGIVLYYFMKADNMYSISRPLKVFCNIISLFLLLTLCTSIEIIEFHVIMGLLLLILSVSSFNNTCKATKFLSILGKNSYGIYLLHWCLITIFTEVSSRLCINTSSLITFFVYYILLLLLSLICAILVNKYIEKPILSLIEKKLK